MLQAVIIACPNNLQSAQALALLRGIPTIGLTPNVISHNEAISALGKCQKSNEALLLLKEAVTVGITADTMSRSSAMKACGHYGRWKEVMALFQKKSKFGIFPDPYIYSSAIATCRVCRQSRQAVTFSRGVERWCSSQRHTLQRGHNYERKRRRLGKILSALEINEYAEGFPNMFSYLAAISTCGGTGK